jgi:flavin-dependent thymidylate synthase
MNVELIGHYGSDEVIALSAWTSTSRDLSVEKRNRIPQLVRSLWLSGHETPFEKAQLHFLVDCDIASHIHLLKHRMSSLNAESARYKELKDDKSFIPTDWVTEDSTLRQWAYRLKKATDLNNKLYHKCLAEITPILGRKRAKESARFFKMYNTEITSDVMFNMRSFANFIKLRNSKHAQTEIRTIAQLMWDAVKNIPGDPFKSTLEVIEDKNMMSHVGV